MAFWMYALVVACEQVAPQGDPLQPVVIASESSADAAPAGANEEDDEALDDEVFTISSEELMEAAGQQPDAQASTSKTDALAAEDSVETPTADKQPPKVDDSVAAAVAVESAPAVPTASAPKAAGWGEVIGKAWPVRLVTTVPNATPPRAILGLPDGREVVVNPGSMVPDMGLVVVAIAPNSAELARIAPAGDHATIETMTLRAQY